MNAILSQFILTGPLYAFALFGFVAVKLFPVPVKLQSFFAKLLFSFLIPALLFSLMSDSSRFSHMEGGVLIAFFGGCFVVFFLGQWIARKCLGLKPSESSVFSIGGVFSNNVMLGLPLAQLTLGAKAIPTVAMVLVFNSLILWTLVTVSVEWARHGNLNWNALLKTLKGVLLNPVIIGIGLGTIWSLTGLGLPDFVKLPLSWISQIAGPAALLSLGMSLATYRSEKEWRITGSLTAVKLFLHPFLVWAIAIVIGLPNLETRVVVLLASIAIGSNVYLMAKQFGVLEKSVSQALLFSTCASTITTPLILALIPS